jgi:hypothetical protein
MRQQNKFMSSYKYEGNKDKGGNNQHRLTKIFFKPFSDSKNLQIHGSIPNGSGSVGGVGIPVKSYNAYSKHNSTRYL